MFLLKKGEQPERGVFGPGLRFLTGLSRGGGKESKGRESLGGRALLFDKRGKAVCFRQGFGAGKDDCKNLKRKNHEAVKT